MAWAKPQPEEELEVVAENRARNGGARTQESSRSTPLGTLPNTLVRIHSYLTQ